MLVVRETLCIIGCYVLSSDSSLSEVDPGFIRGVCRLPLWENVIHEDKNFALNMVYEFLYQSHEKECNGETSVIDYYRQNSMTCQGCIYSLLVGLSEMFLLIIKKKKSLEFLEVGGGSNVFTHSIPMNPPLLKMDFAKIMSSYSIMVFDIWYHTQRQQFVIENGRRF